MKENCKLQEGLSSENLDVLDFLPGVHPDELQKELLKEKNPKINRPIHIARDWIHRMEMNRKFEAAFSA